MEDVNWKKYATKVEKEIQENISEKVMAVGMWENTIKDVLKQEAAKEIGIKKIKVGPLRLKGWWDKEKEIANRKIENRIQRRL